MSIARALRIRQEVEELLGEVADAREALLCDLLERGGAEMREEHRVLALRRDRLARRRHPDILPPCPERCGRRLPSYKAERCAECAARHLREFRRAYMADYGRRRYASHIAARAPRSCSCGAATPSHRHDYCAPCGRERALRLKREAMRRLHARRTA